jgi:hypothetical protein
MDERMCPITQTLKDLANTLSKYSFENTLIFFEYAHTSRNGVLNDIPK